MVEGLGVSWEWMKILYYSRGETFFCIGNGKRKFIKKRDEMME